MKCRTYLCAQSIFTVSSESGLGWGKPCMRVLPGPPEPEGRAQQRGSVCPRAMGALLGGAGNWAFEALNSRVYRVQPKPGEAQSPGAPVPGSPVSCRLAAVLIHLSLHVHVMLQHEACQFSECS